MFLLLKFEHLDSVKSFYHDEFNDYLCDDMEMFDCMWTTLNTNMDKKYFSYLCT